MKRYLLFEFGEYGQAYNVAGWEAFRGDYDTIGEAQRNNRHLYSDWQIVDTQTGKIVEKSCRPNGESTRKAVKMNDNQPRSERPMTKTLTVEWLTELNACAVGMRWFKAQKETDSSKVLEKLLAEDQWDYFRWLAVRLMDKPQCVQWAIYCAEQVIGIYEKKYPDDVRPRKAIEAAKAYLANPCDATKKAASSATYAADDAADAAYAADAAASSATYAASSASSATFAAQSAGAGNSYAAYAADAAADDADDAAAYAADARQQMRTKMAKYAIEILQKARGK